MRRSTRGRGLVLGASLLALVGFGCTPETVTPTPPPTTPASATPAETAQEREERLAYAAAERSYREFRAELYRVLRAGGSDAATPTMEKVAGGPYLSEATEIVQAYKGERGRSVGQERVVSVRGDGYSATELVLEACDDTSKVKTLNREGKVISKGEFRASNLTVRLEGTTWKIWSGTGKRVNSCDGS